MASSGLLRGAIFAASISVVCKCLLRCFDSGVGWTVLPELFSACNYSITTTVQYKFFTQALGKCAYRAEETDVPAAAKTGDISDSAKERKDWTTTGSNCVPLASVSRRTASWYGRPLR